MEIKILGTGCPKCKKLHENAQRAIDEMGLKADIEKVTDITKIVDYGVMSTPALVVDGAVKCEGRIPDVKEVKQWLK